MATKNIGRDEDEHFDSLTLLVLKFGMEGLSRTEKNRLSYLKYLETVFKMNQNQSSTPSVTTISSQPLYVFRNYSENDLCRK